MFLFSNIVFVVSKHTVSNCSYMEISERFSDCISHFMSLFKKKLFQHILKFDLPREISLRIQKSTFLVTGSDVSQNCSLLKFPTLSSVQCRT